jgi:hypothetical protein
VQRKPRHEKRVNFDLREEGLHSFILLHLEKSEGATGNRGLSCRYPPLCIRRKSIAIGIDGFEVVPA